MLFITGTTLNVPSLMGAIMAVGVASANSILLVTFAREQQLAGKTAFEAAIEAGHTRIRPVLMTAAAMIVGMIPMAIGGAGEEQNAALARAVIGGLLFATPTTLLVVPYLFAMLRKGNDGKQASWRVRRGAGMNFNNRSRSEPSVGGRREGRPASQTRQPARRDWLGSGLLVLLARSALAVGAWATAASIASRGDARAAPRPRSAGPRSDVQPSDSTNRHRCRPPPRPSRPPMSLPAPAAISTSAKSISAIT